MTALGSVRGRKGSVVQEANTSEAAADELPTEVRTFLIVDVRGYTAYTQQRGDEDAARLVATFADLTRSAIAKHSGEVVEFRGDEALAVFQSPRAAIRAALALQRRFAEARESQPDMPLVAGVGIDAGEAVRVEGGYRGGALNLASRLCAAAGPGEVLASETVVSLARKIPGVAYGARRSLPIKGFADDVFVVPILSDADGGLRVTSAGSSSRVEDVQKVQPVMPVGGFLGAQPEGELIDRDRALAVVNSALTSVQAGAGRVVLISGEPGIGKTRFAQQALLYALERQFHIGAATCYESRQTVPFFALQEALAILASTGNPEASKQWPDVLQALSGAEPGSNAARPERDQDQVFRDTGGFVQSVARGGPVAIMLDDLQWADASSLELLVYLARQTRAARVLLLGTYRDVDVTRDHRLYPLLLELDRQKLVDWIQLRRLDVGATGRLASAIAGAEALPGDLIQLIYERTDGNPYFTQEVVRSLLDRGDIRREDGRWNISAIASIQVPERVRALIDQRLVRLEKSAVEVLIEASVLGSTFTFDELAALSPQAEEQIERALEQSVAAGLLREVDRDAFTFTHPLARQALYDGLSGRRRKRLHKAAGEALLASRQTRASDGRARSTSALIAWHFLQADDSARALEFAIRAGDEAEAVYAHAEAERHFRQALDVARVTADESRVAEVLERLAAVLRTLGRYDEALDAIEQAIQTYETNGDSEGERRAVALSALLESLREHPEEGLARLDAMLEREEQAEPTPGRVLIQIARAQVLLALRRFEEAVTAAEHAGTGAKRLGDRSLLAEAEVRRGEALGSQGDFDTAGTVLEQALSLARGGSHGTIVRALNGIGSATFYAGQFERSRSYHERALALAIEAVDPRGIAVSRAALGWRLHFLGLWGEARKSLEDAVVTAEQYDMQSMAEQTRHFLAHIALLEGRLDDFDRLLELSARPRTDRQKSAVSEMSALLYANKAIMEGHYGVALERLHPLATAEAGANWHSGAVALALSRALLGNGKLAEADALVARTASQAVAHKNRPTFVESLWVRGMTRVLQQQWDEAARLFEGARSLAHEMPFPFLEAVTLRSRGTAYAARGMESRARRDLEDALAIFRSLDAKPYVRQVLESFSRVESR